MERRNFLKLSAAALSAGTFANASWLNQARAQAAALKEVRIGYQKTGVLVITRQQQTLEKRFAAQGIGVKWVEFTSGPPMMEAISQGSVDFGAVGDSPPIFAQAADANIVYAAASAISNGQGILVPKESAIRTVADLKGRRLGFTKGSSAHNVVIATLEKFGLSYNDITPVYLQPPDAGPAFANGSIDAWAVWDPYFAIGEIKQNARILINAQDVAKTNSYFIANRDFAQRQSAALRQVLAGIDEAAFWGESHRDAVAKSLNEVTGVPLDIQTVAANRATFTIGPVTDEVVATQQGVADRYYKLGLIPKPIIIKDIVWKPVQS